MTKKEKIPPAPVMFKVDDECQMITLFDETMKEQLRFIVYTVPGTKTRADIYRIDRPHKKATKQERETEGRLVFIERVSAFEDGEGNVFDAYGAAWEYIMSSLEEDDEVDPDDEPYVEVDPEMEQIDTINDLLRGSRC